MVICGKLNNNYFAFIIVIITTYQKSYFIIKKCECHLSYIAFASLIVYSVISPLP